MNCKWLPVQTVRTDTPQGHLLLKLLLNNVGAICMHTNLDAADGGVNDCLAKALQLEEPGPLGREEEKLCRMGSLKEPMQLEAFVKFVSKSLGCNGVRYAGAGKTVCRVAVGGGSCGNSQDAVIAAGCDTFVTSDLGYHDFLDAAGKGINLIDAGHFPTEDVVCKEVISYLTARFPELSVEKSTSHKEVIQYYVEGDL
jgi:dinuclear metal center YbgI/SA1388 family protein